MENCEWQELWQQISQKTSDELDEILKAIMLRYSELLPAHKLVCLFLPKYDSKERKRILSRVERLCFPQTE